MRLALAGILLLAALPLSGCFLSAAEVGTIAGEVVSAAVARAKEESRTQIAEATAAAAKVVEERLGPKVDAVAAKVDAGDASRTTPTEQAGIVALVVAAMKLLWSGGAAVVERTKGRKA